MISAPQDHKVRSSTLNLRIVLSENRFQFSGRCGDAVGITSTSTASNIESVIGLALAVPVTSLTPVKSPFNQRANTGPQCPVVSLYAQDSREADLYFPEILLK
ncbi:hypothetical protein MESS4_550006 [Mesorhizobium sp. STM 4661]|nr:hypothetical protein MESS4_550006 [Mesorhizobium sp. STM 4661]